MSVGEFIRVCVWCVHVYVWNVCAVSVLYGVCVCGVGLWAEYVSACVCSVVWCVMCVWCVCMCGVCSMVWCGCVYVWYMCVVYVVRCVVWCVWGYVVCMCGVYV